MTWSGPGVPIIGGQVLSGAEAIIFKGSRYLVEHPIAGMEGGIVENLGRPQARIEIHGVVYQSGSDAFAAAISGFINSFREIHVPSFNSGYYFIQSGIGVMFEEIQFHYDAGYGSPQYHYVLVGVLSGEVTGFVPASGLFGITYVQPNLVLMQLTVNYVQPNMVNEQIYGTYVQPNQIWEQVCGSYALISGVSGY